MSQAEKRRNERYHPNGQPDGRLFIRAGSIRHPVISIRDISSAGISVALDHDFSGATDVTVEYLSPNAKVEVFGRIVWRSTGDPLAKDGKAEAHSLGIELLGSTILATALRQT